MPEIHVKVQAVVNVVLHQEDLGTFVLRLGLHGDVRKDSPVRCLEMLEDYRPRLS